MSLSRYDTAHLWQQAYWPVIQGPFASRNLPGCCADDQRTSQTDQGVPTRAFTSSLCLTGVTMTAAAVGLLAALATAILLQLYTACIRQQLMHMIEQLMHARMMSTRT